MIAERESDLFVGFSSLMAAIHQHIATTVKNSEAILRLHSLRRRPSCLLYHREEPNNEQREIRQQKRHNGMAVFRNMAYCLTWVTPRLQIWSVVGSEGSATRYTPQRRGPGSQQNTKSILFSRLI
jgi:hypothetical protein